MIKVVWIAPTTIPSTSRVQDSKNQSAYVGRQRSHRKHAPKREKLKQLFFRSWGWRAKFSLKKLHNFINSNPKLMWINKKTRADSGSRVRAVGFTLTDYSNKWPIARVKVQSYLVREAIALERYEVLDPFNAHKISGFLPFAGKNCTYCFVSLFDLACFYATSSKTH